LNLQRGKKGPRGRERQRNRGGARRRTESFWKQEIAASDQKKRRRRKRKGSKNGENNRHVKRRPAARRLPQGMEGASKRGREEPGDHETPDDEIRPQKKKRYQKDWVRGQKEWGGVK